MNPKYQEIIGLWREIPTVKNIMMEKNIERTNLNYTLDWTLMVDTTLPRHSI